MQSIHITTSITREEIDSFISRGEMNVTHSMLISDLSVSVVQLLQHPLQLSGHLPYPVHHSCPSLLAHRQVRD
jgi:hypothetical protein